MLLPFAESKVIAHVVDKLLSRAVYRTLFILGYEAERVAQAFFDAPWRS